MRRLLVADGIVLQGYPRADAYVALFPSLSKVVLPTGVDLAHNIPPSDVTLLAVEASLVVRKDLNPAIQYLLLAAAAEIHGGPDIFNKPGRFPAAEAVDLPQRTGPGVLPVGRPVRLSRAPAVAGGHHGAPADSAHPAPGGGVSLFRFLPAAYQYLVETRIYRLHGRLRLLEQDIEEAGEGQLGALSAELDELARQASHLSVPLYYSQRLFILKGHIGTAREQVDKRLHQGAMARF